MTYRQFKTAGAAEALTHLSTALAQGATQLTTTGAVYLLALTGATGVGLGYAAAKATAHGKKDIDTVKKEYENERLKADLGYLSAKANSEYTAFKNRQAPTAARVIA